MNAWIKMGVAAGALAFAGCQDRDATSQQGWPEPGETSAASGPVENVQGQGPQDNNAAQSGYGGSGDTNLNTEQPINAVGPQSAQPTPDGYGEDTANNDRSTLGTTGETSGTSMGTTGQPTGTGGASDEGTSGSMSTTGGEPGGEAVDTSDEPRPHENGADPMLQQPGTGGAGMEGTGEEEERSEGGTGTPELKPGETDARTGEVGTGGAGAAGTGADAGTGFDSVDGVNPEDGTGY